MEISLMIYENFVNPFERLVSFITGLFRNVELNSKTVPVYAALSVISYIYEYYGFTTGLVAFGWKAVPFLTIGAGFLCWLGILVLDLLKMDYFGAESVRKELDIFQQEFRKNIQKKAGRQFRILFFRIQVDYDLAAINWWLDHSVYVVLLFSALKFDAIATTMYYRGGKHRGLSKKDWVVFIISLVISCICWSVVVLCGIELFSNYFDYVLAFFLAVWEKPPAGPETILRRPCLFYV